MKKIFLGLCAAALMVPAIAQNFEGAIKYSVTYSGSAEIEQMKPMMPTAYKFAFLGNDSKFVMEGGMMAAMMGDIITKSDEKYTYIVSHSNKAVNKIKIEEDKKEGPAPVVTKEKGTAKILGYDCQKYKVVQKSAKGETNMTTYLWAAKDLKVKVTEGMGNGNFGYKGIEGFPLKIESNVGVGETTMVLTLTAVSIDKNKPDAKEFEIPAGYTMTEGMPDMMKMMGK